MGEILFKLPLAKKLFEVFDKNGYRRISSVVLIGLVGCLIAIVSVDLEFVYSNSHSVDPLLEHIPIYIIFIFSIGGYYVTRTYLSFYQRYKLLKLFRDKPEALDQIMKLVIDENGHNTQKVDY
jgi:hypothetical protein